MEPRWYMFIIFCIWGTFFVNFIAAITLPQSVRTGWAGGWAATLLVCFMAFYLSGVDLEVPPGDEEAPPGDEDAPTGDAD